MLKELIKHVEENRDLAEPQIQTAVQALISEGDARAVEDKADFLCAMSTKGETVEELSGFALALRGLSVMPPVDPATRSRPILDLCGTGGDGLGTFNISTTAALVAAAAGVTVAKHGNRAITSRAGSADLLEALDIRIELEPDEAARWLKDYQFAFLFAPRYHPAFKHIGPARKLCAERGRRTLFNFMGPLLNPARPSVQLIGVPRPDLCEPMARALQSLGARRGMVACGTAPTDSGPRYLDELSTLGESRVAEFYLDHGFSASTLALAGFDAQPAQLDDLIGGDSAANARIAKAILAGEERGPKRESVLLNAGAALFVAGAASSILEGWRLAAETVDSGKAKDKLEELQKASAPGGS